jgi:DNA primase small subunit
LNTSTLAFLRSVYKEYYFKHSGTIELPAGVEEREFGYVPFGGGMIRHLSFASKGQAVAEIVRQAPASVYCSNARYSSPSLPMEEKGWKGAELIFDIDAGDIPTQCKKTHDLWYCVRCGTYGRLPRPPECPSCKSQTDEFRGSCITCLTATKDHALRVIDFLTHDFGTSKDEIFTYFSGNRGYHLHVYDRRFLSLSSQARAEISDYMRGTSLQSSQTLLSSVKILLAQKGDGLGWTGRIAMYVQKTRKNSITQRMINEAIRSQIAMVDPSVTTDIHRVFRLAGTLHGTTGMLKKRVDSFERFDVTNDPVVLGEEEVRLHVSFYPRFSLRGRTFGPFKNEEVRIPVYAAISILTRGLAEVA